RARAVAVADAQAVRSLADAARTGADAGVTAVLARTADDAASHLTALGGVYVSGLVGPTTAAAPPPTPTPTSPVTPVQRDTRAVVDLLVSAADRSRAAAVSVPDGPLARLLASITVSRLQDARALVAAAGLPADGTTEAPTPSTDIPSGASLPTAEVTQIVLIEDQAGFAEEVAAAWLDATARAKVLARAERHRERAREWAVQASIDSTSRDPRRAAYALPVDPHDAGTAGALVATVETALASAYLTAVASSDPTPAQPTVPTTSTTVTTPPGPAPSATSTAPRTPATTPAAGARGLLITFADDAWATASTWGAAPSALPTITRAARRPPA
ncbi:MAG: DUF4439 domain-containing protein, partial [Cellulomonas sp.]